MKKQQKTLLALLALVLCVALLAVLPMTVSAAEGEPTIVTTEAELTEALAAGGSIQLGANITATANCNIASGKTVILDLNSFTLDMGGYSLENYGTLELCDSVGGGQVIGSGERRVLYNSNATFTLTSGTVSNSNTGYNASVIYNTSGGEVIINGGTISGENYGVYTDSGSLTVNGGTISTTGNALATIYIWDETNLIISGGEIHGLLGILMYSGTVEMTGGTIYAQSGMSILDGTVTVIGGKITDVNLDPDYSGIGIQNTGGTVTFGGSAEIEVTKDYGGGIENNVGTVNMSGGTINVTGANAVGIVQGNGFDESKLSLTGGTVTGGIKAYIGTVADCLVPGYLYYNENGEVIALTEGQTELTEKVTVAPCQSHAYVDGTCSFCKYICTHDNINTQTGVCEVCNKQWALGVIAGMEIEFFDSLPDAIAKAEEMSTQFNAESIVKLFANLTMNSSATLNSGTIILDLNGFTLDMGANSIYNHGTFELRDSGSNGSLTGSGEKVINNYGHFTLTSGTVGNTTDVNGSKTAVYNSDGETVINGGAVSGGQYCIYNDDGGVTINGGRVTTSGNHAIWNYGSLTVTGGEIEASGVIYSGAGSVNLTGGTYSTTTSHSYAIINNGSNITVSGSTVIKAEYEYCRGIQNISGTLNVSGGTINATGSNAVGIENLATLSLSGGAITGGITTTNNMADCLAAGYVFYNEGDAVITLTEGQKELSGTVTVAPCRNHTGGTATCDMLAVCELCTLAYGTYYHADDDQNGFCDECGKLPITEVTFPDETFRTYIAENIDTDGDGLLSLDEIAAVTELYIQQMNITTLAGAQYFTNLEVLAAGENSLTDTELNFSMLTKLYALDLIGAYDLVSLDVSGCTELNDLRLDLCISLTSLDLSNNLMLYSLNVIHAGALTSLDLSVHENLNYLNIDGTTLTSLKLHPNADVMLDGEIYKSITHCGVGYFNMSSLVSDLSQIVKVENGTLGADGWLKLDDGVTYFMYYTATGNTDAPLPHGVSINTPAGYEHTFIDQPVSKDETGHYAQSCSTCRTVKEESVVAHTIKYDYTTKYTDSQHREYCTDCDYLITEACNYASDCEEICSECRLTTRVFFWEEHTLIYKTYIDGDDDSSNDTHDVRCANCSSLDGSYEFCYYEFACSETCVCGRANPTAIAHTEQITTESDGTHDKICTVCEKLLADNEDCVYLDTVDNAYLASPATCVSGTTYYKSCACGHVSDETFEDTDLNPDNHVSDVDDGDCTTAIYCVGHHIVITPAKDSHDFSGAYLHNDNGHWKKCQNCDVTGEQDYHTGQSSGDCTKPTLCACGYVMAEATGHSSKTIVFYTDDYHYEGCLNCTLPVNDVRTPHDFSISDSNEYDHWNKCSGCDKETEYIPHSGDNGGDCTKDSTCSCGYVTKVAETSHDFGTEILSDAEGHYHKCKNCDVIDEKVAHTPDDDRDCMTDDNCTACGYLVTKGQLSHNFNNANLYDESGHWHKCSRCDVTAAKYEHSFTVSGKDGTHHWNKCEECEATDTKTLHTFTVAQNDGTHHWNKCSGCDATDTKAEHSGTEDGFCDVCAKLVVDGVVTDVSLSLDGDIGINFYWVLSDDVINNATAYFLVTLPNGDTEQIPVTSDLIATPVGTSVSGRTYYKVTGRVAAKEMAENIKVELVVDNASLASAQCSVRGYAERAFGFASENPGSVDDKLITMMKAMLNYGAASQMLFDHNTGDLANSILSDEDKIVADVNSEQLNDVTVNANLTGIKNEDFSCILETKTTIRHYFSITEGTVEDYYFAVEGREVTPVQITRNGKTMYYVDITDIAAKDMDYVYTFMIVDKNYNASYVYASVYSYMNAVIKNKDNTDLVKPELVDTINAMYAYGFAAYSYFR